MIYIILTEMSLIWQKENCLEMENLKYNILFIDPILTKR